jgi:hypothetical protein
VGSRGAMPGIGIVTQGAPGGSWCMEPQNFREKAKTHEQSINIGFLSLVVKRMPAVLITEGGETQLWREGARK